MLGSTYHVYNPYKDKDLINIENVIYQFPFMNMIMKLYWQQENTV